MRQAGRPLAPTIVYSILPETAVIDSGEPEAPSCFGRQGRIRHRIRPILTYMFIFALPTKKASSMECFRKHLYSVPHYGILKA